MKYLALMVMLFGVTANAVAGMVAVSFDHSGEADNTIRSLQAGDQLEITIDKTCPSQFEYAVHGIKKPPAAADTPKPQAGAVALTADETMAVNGLKKLLCTEVKSQKLDTVYHDSSFGGYEVTAKRKADALGLVFKVVGDQTLEQSVVANGALRSCVIDPSNSTAVTDQAKIKACLQTKAAPSVGVVSKDKPLYELTDRRFLVQVTESSWQYDFSGGIFLTKAVNQRYSAVANTTAQYTIVRNTGGEDDYGAGIGMFITASPKTGLCLKNDICWAPLTMGLGASNQSDLNVFAGTSVKFGRNAFLTLGMNFAQIETLPGNLRVGDSIADPNALTTLDKKRVAKPFIAFTYTFFGDGGAALQKRISPAGN